MDESKLLSHAAINSWESGVRDMGAPGTPSITAQHMQGRVCLGGGERRLGREGLQNRGKRAWADEPFCGPFTLFTLLSGKDNKSTQEAAALRSTAEGEV